MNILSRLFRKPDTTAELRDRLLEAETQLALLREIVTTRRRSLREIRSDAKSYREARKAMTQRLIDERKDAVNLPLAEAIEAGRGRAA